jgi:hypothetical protein
MHISSYFIEHGLIVPLLYPIRETGVNPNPENLREDNKKKLGS